MTRLGDDPAGSRSYGGDQLANTGTAAYLTVPAPAAPANVGAVQVADAFQVTWSPAPANPASVPIIVTSARATVVPAAPTGVTARWTAPGSPGDTLAAGWAASLGGDSPVDAYEVTITGSDGGGTVTQTVAGASLAAVFPVSDTPDWSIKVRAHNAAGWSAWSAGFTLGGA